MNTIKYVVENYKDDPRPFDTYFFIIARIKANDKIYFVVRDTFMQENYIREYIPVNKQKDLLQQGDILISIDSDIEWNQIYTICRKEGILE